MLWEDARALLHRLPLAPGATVYLGGGEKENDPLISLA